MRRREAGSDKAHQVVVSHVLHLIFPMRKYTIKREGRKYEKITSRTNRIKSCYFHKNIKLHSLHLHLPFSIRVVKVG